MGKRYEEHQENKFSLKMTKMKDHKKMKTRCARQDHD